MVDEGRVAPTLETSPNVGYVEEEGKRIRIRKLTPRECFRLQAFPDEYFDRAAAVNSDSQLYKQAGNSVTVSVIYEFAKRFCFDDNSTAISGERKQNEFRELENDHRL